MEKKQKKSRVLPALAALLCLMALFLGLYALSRPETAAGSKTITVEVVHADGSTRTVTCRTEAEYLGDVLLAEELVTGEMGPYGLYIQSVDGESAHYETDRAYWALFQGQDYATQGADQIVIQDGDAFRLVYTIG